MSALPLETAEFFSTADDAIRHLRLARMAESLTLILPFDTTQITQPEVADTTEIVPLPEIIEVTEHVVAIAAVHEQPPFKTDAFTSREEPAKRAPKVQTKSVKSIQAEVLAEDRRATPFTSIELSILLHSSQVMPTETNELANPRTWRRLLGTRADSMSGSQLATTYRFIEQIMLTKYGEQLTNNDRLQILNLRRVLIEGMTWDTLHVELGLPISLSALQVRSTGLASKIHQYIPSSIMDQLVSEVSKLLPHRQPVAEKPTKSKQLLKEPLQRSIYDVTPTSSTTFDKSTSRANSGYNNDGIKDYLKAIGRYQLLTASEEVSFAKTIERGLAAAIELETATDPAQKSQLRREVSQGLAAKEAFTQANLRLVVSLAKRYPLPQAIDLMDLIQEGNIGMAHAVEKFDWRKGFKFSTYATFWIRQAIGRYLDQNSTLIHLPGDRTAQLRTALRNASGESSQLSSEIAELHRISTPTSLNKPVGDDGDTEFGDMLPNQLPGPEDELMKDHISGAISKVLDSLDYRAAFAIKLRFGLLDGEKHSYHSIGESLGITAEASRRMVERALTRIRDEPKYTEMLS